MSNFKHHKYWIFVQSNIVNDVLYRNDDEYGRVSGS